METKIQFRCSKEFKEMAYEKQEKRGYSTLAEYIRHLIKKDKQ